MRDLRFSVLWFFIFTFALTFLGQGVHHYVMHRLSAGTPGGIPIHESPVFAWMPYGFYLTNAGPSFVGLLMTFWLYGLPGVRRLVSQLTPWSVGWAWPVLAVGLFLPLVIVVLPLTILGTPTDSWSLSSFVFGAVISNGLIGPGFARNLAGVGSPCPSSSDAIQLLRAVSSSELRGRFGIGPTISLGPFIRTRLGHSWNDSNRHGHGDHLYVGLQFDRRKSLRGDRVARSHSVHTKYLRSCRHLHGHLDCSLDLHYHCDWSFVPIRSCKPILAR